VTRYCAKMTTLTRRLAPRFLAVLLALSALAVSTAPLVSAASAEACAMDCCASMKDRVGGACPMHASAPPVKLQRDPGDPLCRPSEAGKPTLQPSNSETIKVVAGADGTATDSAPASTDSSEPTPPHFSQPRMATQCGQDCGACGAAASHSRNGRDAVAQWSPGPSGTASSIPLRLSSSTSPSLRSALLRAIIPRGPPASSSI
jgi:hypothetical protein